MDSEETYAVVLLVEQALTPADATAVRALHTELDDDPTIAVIYHVIQPMADAAAAVEASLGAMGGPDLAAPVMTPSPEDIQALRDEHRHQAEDDLAATLTALSDAGAQAHGSITSEPPIDALIAKVAEVDGREAIVLTRPHVVAEFFHVDWTSRARRKLGVPVLHLLEHDAAS